MCVQEALCDEEAGVRDQAAVAFATLHRLCGTEAVVDSIVPSLLGQLKREESRERAILGLCQVKGRARTGAGGKGQ